MSRYYFHLRGFRGDVFEDEEGSELPSLAAARDHALIELQEILGQAIKHGEDVHFEAVVVADEHGRHLASVPVTAALPIGIVNSLTHPAKAIPSNRFEEYRCNADGCRRMADDASSPDDKASWLKLADAWLHMLPQPARAAGADSAGWPDASDQGSKASH